MSGILPPMAENRTSRLSGFYQKSIAERVAIVTDWAGLSAEEGAALEAGLQTAQADKMVENVIGRYSLPLGIATNFLINGKEYLIPMVVEEPSVVAAVSNAARIIRAGGGFRTGSTEPIMIAQIQLLEVADAAAAEEAILNAKADLLEIANTSPSIKARGGGPRDIQVRHLPATPTGSMLIVHLLFDVRDAMGANAVNTAAEALSPRLEALSGGRALLRILSNYSDQRRAWAEVTIPANAFDPQSKPDQPTTHYALRTIENISHANAFAIADPYRAATHNKGIFNGIDAVALATGNDWRAIEAGGHAWATRDGQYRGLTEWRVVSDKVTRWQGDKADCTDGDASVTLSSSHLVTLSLYGKLEVPLAVGTVGGSTVAHPTARVAMKILNVASARELSEVMVAVGLAQNLAALRALTTEGIQQGHMRLHARKAEIGD